MTAAVPNDLARALRAFFADHLPRVRGTSPHTIRSYRDSLVLLLRFVATRLQRSVIQLDLDDLGPQPVLAFLQHLELDRHNSVATRNVRLAAIHAFFRYCAMEHPARLAHCQRVLAVPFKRTGSRPVEYLEHEEIEAILGAVDRGTADGRRDYALLATMFNTGARVGEIVALCVADLRLDAPAQVHLHGKGRKQRVCPLWPQTADLLRALLAERERELQSDEPVFRNHRGMRLTRFGVRYLLQKYCTPRAGHGADPAHQAPPSPQHAAQHGRPPAPGRRRHRHHQSVARPRQRHDHAPLRHRRSRHEAAGAREGSPHHPAPPRGRPCGARTRRCSNGSKRSEEAIGNVESGDALRAPLGTAVVFRCYSTLPIAQH